VTAIALPTAAACFPADSLLPLDQWVFNTEAHPLPILGSAADAAVRQHYVQLRSIADAHAARIRTMNGTADNLGDSSGKACSESSSSGNTAAADVVSHTAGDSTQQQSPVARQAFDAAAAAFGCRLQMQLNATGQPQGRQNPLQAYIRMWRVRQAPEVSGAGQQDLDQEVLRSHRQTAVNADIAVCEAELASWLRQEQAAAGVV
jgi:hypothetical protein